MSAACVIPSTMAEPSCVVPPQLGIAERSSPAPHVAPYVPHLVSHVPVLAFTGVDIVTLAFFGAVLVMVGLLAKGSRGKYR